MTGLEVLLIPILVWVYMRDIKTIDERDRLKRELERRAQGPRR